MSNSKDKEFKEQEKAQELYEFLQGKFIPEGYELNNTPKLNQKEASSVIYILQEYFRILSNTIEKCDHCGGLFDSDSSGKYHDCDACEKESCQKMYQLADPKKLKKEMMHKFFCCACCEMNYLKGEGVI